MARSIQQSEDKEIYGEKGKSIGQKEVAQMMRTREMSNEERKQSKEESTRNKTEKKSGREAPGT